jgi:hypothetical protein
MGQSPTDVTEPFGGTITHDSMPPNTVTARVAYFWWDKDKPAFLGIHWRDESYVHLIDVHLLQA